MPIKIKAIVRIMNHIKNGSFFRVKQKYSSKTLLIGRQLTNMQGNTVINQTSYVYKGIEDANRTQKYVGDKVLKENNSIFE